MPSRRRLEKSVLFLGMDLSFSGQIAEAIAKRLAPPDTKIFSAAVEPREVPEAAVEVMREVEVDLPAERPKPLESVPIDHIDLVVALGEAGESSPKLPPRTGLVYWTIP